MVHSRDVKPNSIQFIIHYDHYYYSIRGFFYITIYRSTSKELFLQLFRDWKKVICIHFKYCKEQK